MNATLSRKNVFPAFFFAFCMCATASADFSSEFTCLPSEGMQPLELANSTTVMLEYGQFQRNLLEHDNDGPVYALVHMCRHPEGQNRLALAGDERMMMQFAGHADGEPGMSEVILNQRVSLSPLVYVASIDEELLRGMILAFRPRAEDEQDVLIDWIGEIPASTKLPAQTADDGVPQWARTARRTIMYLVGFHDGVPNERIDRVLQRNDVQRHEEYVDGTWAVELPVDCDRECLERLASENIVKNISFGPPPFRPHNNTTRAALEVDAVSLPVVPGCTQLQPPQPPTFENIEFDGRAGADVIAAVMDTPIDGDHDDFWRHDSDGARVASRILYRSTTGAEPHGTHIAGTIAGNGYHSQADPACPFEHRGIAPRASLLSYGLSISVAPPVQFKSAIFDHRADVSNHSYYQSCVYDEFAGIIDSLVTGDAVVKGVTVPARPAVWSAGNRQIDDSGMCAARGYYSLEATAKNPIVVGASFSVWLDAALGTVPAFKTSIGPTPDGRIKPDVIAPGCRLPTGVKSTHPGNVYEYHCSTSQAAAAVTGVVALLIEEWRNKFSLSGRCSAGTAINRGYCLIATADLERSQSQSVFEAITGEIGDGVSIGSRRQPGLFSFGYPLPSTIKAVLVHGATDLVGETLVQNSDFVGVNPKPKTTYGRGPDWVSGFGLINADRSVDLIRFGPGNERRIVESSLVADPDADNGIVSVDYDLVVPPGEEKLRVTLAWDDEPGSELLGETEHALVNDLDVVVIRDGTEYHYPWWLEPPDRGVPGTGNCPAIVDPQADADCIDPTQVAPATIPTEKKDDINNVEQVEVFPSDGETLLPAGMWRIRVSASNLESPSQAFSLVADFPIRDPALVTENRRNSPRLECLPVDWRARIGGFEIELPKNAACGVVGMGPLCRYGIGCPPCERWGYCPNVGFAMSEIPEYMRIEVRDSSGNPVADHKGGSREAVMTWQPEPGEDYRLYFRPVEGRQMEGRYRFSAAAFEWRSDHE